MRMKLVALLGAGMLLAGCSTAPSEPKPTPSAVAQVAEAATQEQVASVIARNESTFRDTNEKTFECRFSYSTNAESLESFTCITEQKTVVLTAQNVARDLRSLTPPDSMDPLVSETVAMLDLLGKVDLSPCGDQPDPANEDCSAALTGLDMNLSAIASTLDAWKPYL